jgi:hypothetical protein
LLDNLKRRAEGDLAWRAGDIPERFGKNASRRRAWLCPYHRAMRAVATFDVSASPDAVVAYLSLARNLLMANHEGPVLEETDTPTGAGSWAVLAFDQLRVRIEYTAFEPPALVAASMTYSGRGSAGMRGTFVYRLTPLSAGLGTRVTVEADAAGGPLPDVITRLLWPLMVRRLRTRMEKTALRTG